MVGATVQTRSESYPAPASVLDAAYKLRSTTPQINTAQGKCPRKRAPKPPARGQDLVRCKHRVQRLPSSPAAPLRRSTARGMLIPSSPRGVLDFSFHHTRNKDELRYKARERMARCVLMFIPQRNGLKELHSLRAAKQAEADEGERDEKRQQACERSRAYRVKYTSS